jgi:UDPglucose 6-dehydrogenase
MRTESAEMVKHALNAFLAVSIAYTNEIARLCEQVGADAREVARGLKSDARIGPNARLNPGAAFAGGTLAREILTLLNLARSRGQPAPILAAVKSSNDQHRLWALPRLQSRLQSLQGKSIAILGLTYKPHTDTLRRSAALDLCRHLLDAGARLRAFDPAIRQLPPDWDGVTLASDLTDALSGADAAVLCTEWPEFLDADWTALLARMRRPLLIDANGFLAERLADAPAVELHRVGLSEPETAAVPQSHS